MRLILAGSCYLPLAANAEPVQAPTPPKEPVLPALTLAEAQQKSLASSPTLREYRSRSAEARFKVDEAYTQAQPTLNMSAGYTRFTPPVSFQLNPRQDVTILAEHNYNVTLSLRQAIYTFGRMQWAAASAELQERSSQAQLSYQVARVVEDATVAYYQARQTHEQLRVAEDNLAARRAHLHDAQVLVKTGVSAPFDAIRDEAALALAEQALVEAGNRGGVARVNLLILMGSPADKRPLDNEELPLPAPPRTSGVETAMAERPDLAAARFARDAARARIELAGAANNPSLSLQSDLVQRNQVAFNPSQQWSVGLVLGLPLYDGGLTASRLNQAKEAAEQLDAIYESLERQVRLEVESLFSDLVSGWKKIEAAERGLASAREAARIASLRYQNGLAPNVERLDAMAALTQAELELINARYQYLIGWARYRRAGGKQ